MRILFCLTDKSWRQKGEPTDGSLKVDVGHRESFMNKK